MNLRVRCVCIGRVGGGERIGKITSLYFNLKSICKVKKEAMHAHMCGICD